MPFESRVTLRFCCVAAAGLSLAWAAVSELSVAATASSIVAATAAASTRDTPIFSDFNKFNSYAHDLRSLPIAGSKLVH